jgi:hypothetical protein
MEKTPMLKTIALTAATVLLASTPALAETQPATSAPAVAAEKPATPAPAVAADKAEAPAPGGPATRSETPTLFHLCEKAWGVGTIHLSKPLTFRDGKVLAFPSQFTDLVWAPKKTKPRNMMIVHEVWPDDKDKPFLEKDQDIFAPILLLPDSAYWKDNLPFTNRHQIAGGRRYVFRGEQIPEARKVVEAYTKALDITGAERVKERVVAVAAALESTIPYIREDAVTWLTEYPVLARDFDDRAIPSIKAYLAGSAPADEKSKLIKSLSDAQIDSVKPLLKEQAAKGDASGAAALRALAKSGEKELTETLLEKSRSSSEEVQAYALEQLGARAGTDDAAFARCKEVVEQVANPVPLILGCVRGLGQAKGERVDDLLAGMVERGDTGSREAATVLGAKASADGIADLTRILEEKRGESALAAAMGLSRVPGCRPCGNTLEHQHHDHPDESVRNVIGILIGAPMVHKH